MPDGYISSDGTTARRADDQWQSTDDVSVSGGATPVRTRSNDLA